MRLRRMAVVLVLGASSLAATAQMAMSAGSGPAAGTIAAPSKAVDSALSLIEMEMLGAVRAMPAEKFGFAPSAAILFRDRRRSLQPCGPLRSRRRTWRRRTTSST